MLIIRERWVFVNKSVDLRGARLLGAIAAMVLAAAMLVAPAALANVLTIVQGTDIEILDVHRVTSSVYWPAPVRKRKVRN